MNFCKGWIFGFKFVLMLDDDDDGTILSVVISEWVLGKKDEGEGEEDEGVVMGSSRSSLFLFFYNFLNFLIFLISFN